MQAWVGSTTVVMGMITVLLLPGLAGAQEGPGVHIDLGPSDREIQMAVELDALLRTYDLEPWTLTWRVRIEQGQIPHSHPVLTLNTRSLGREIELLSSYLHEQLHWLEQEPWTDDWRKAMAEYQELFPEVPTSSDGGARDRESTYRHLLVCDMEYQALAALVGEDTARETLSAQTHYEWIYDKVLNDPRVREIALRHGFDASDGAPGR